MVVAIRLLRLGARTMGHGQKRRLVLVRMFASPVHSFRVLRLRVHLRVPRRLRSAPFKRAGRASHAGYSPWPRGACGGDAVRRALPASLSAPRAFRAQSPRHSRNTKACILGSVLRDSGFCPPGIQDNDDLAGWCAQPVDVVQRLAAVAHCLFDTACVYACAGPRPLRMDPPSMQVPTHHGQRREK